RKIETGRVATPAFSTIAAVAAALSLSLDEIWSTINSQKTCGSPALHPSQLSHR
ncbi:MAG: transcriptional regulator, partial [Glutamicibacter sp.]